MNIGWPFSYSLCVWAEIERRRSERAVHAGEGADRWSSIRRTSTANSSWPIHCSWHQTKRNCWSAAETLMFLPVPFSERELTFTFAMCCLPSVCCLSSVCLALVHPTQSVEIFGNVSTLYGTLGINWHPRKFYGDCPRGTLRRDSGELNARGVDKYSNFGPIEGYISETVEDRR